VRLIAYAGRHATSFMAAGVLAGVVVPPLASLARPLLVPTLLIPLALALVRLDWSAAAAWRHRPGTIALLLAWILVVSPVLVWLITGALAGAGFPASLAQALVLMAASSPIVSNVAIALLLGLDAPLAVVVVLAGTALVPVTLPIAAEALVGVSLDMPVATFMGRLALLVGSAFVAAWLIRRLVAAPTLAAHHDLLDGLTVLNLLLFGLAIMDGVTAYALERPGYVALAIVAAYAFNLLLQAAGGIAFRWLGTRRALTVALLGGNCNMGLVLVALEGRASFDVTVYFALAQIPMYTLPALLRPLYARLERQGRAAR
jgi:BASS family bile acid:Na+ symporter